jgi:hypothetical protein
MEFVFGSVREHIHIHTEMDGSLFVCGDDLDWTP